MQDSVVVFVHDSRSSSGICHRVGELVEEDPHLGSYDVDFVSYSTPRARLNPLRRSLDPEVVARELLGRCIDHLGKYSNIAFVTHDQGGRIVESFLKLVTGQLQGQPPHRIKLFVMLGCDGPDQPRKRGIRNSGRFLALAKPGRRSTEVEFQAQDDSAIDVFRALKPHLMEVFRLEETDAEARHPQPLWGRRLCGESYDFEQPQTVLTLLDQVVR
jgi:hypothetical protein